MSFLSGIAGLFGFDPKEVEARSNVLRIKAVMLKSIKEMVDPKLSDELRVLALKNFEESRSTLEDTAKNFPNQKIRALALKSAQEVLNSKELKDSSKSMNLGQCCGMMNLGGQYFDGPPLYMGLGYSGPPLYNFSGAVYGAGSTPYQNIHIGGAMPNFMR